MNRIDPQPSQAPSFWRSLQAVLWAFMGLRQRSEFEQDGGRVSPLHLIAIGLVLVLVLVIGLMFFVKWVVAR